MEEQKIVSEDNLSEKKANNMPKYKNRLGSLEIAIFDGAYGRNFVIQKSFRKKDTNEWRNDRITLFEREVQQLLDLISNTVVQIRQNNI